MSYQVAAQPDVLLHCLQTASQAAGPAIERCIEEAVTQLQVLETQSLKLAERDTLATGWRYLLVNKAALGGRYSVELLAQFNQPPAKLQPDLKPELPSGRSLLDAIGLVDDADLKRAMNAQRLLQDSLPAVEQTLAELDARISSALGLAHVAPERNPLRPEVFTRVLHQLMTATVEGAEAAALCVRLLGRPLGRELKAIYAEALKTLEQAHVPAASYQFRVQQSASAPLGSLSEFASDGAALPSNQASNDTAGNLMHGGAAKARQPRPTDLSDASVRTGLMSDFLCANRNFSDQDIGLNAGLAAPYYDDIDKELAALKAAPESAAAPFEASQRGRLAAMPSVDRPQRAVDASSPLSEKVWGPYGTARARSLVRTQLKKEAKNVGQVLGLDVVKQLVSQVAQDPRLLAPVREAIVALEPSLLRLAMVDVRFFSDERHPGRQLMERTAQRSFKYNDEFSLEFGVFFQAVIHAFNQLNASPVDSVKPFSAALAGLEQAWDAQDQQNFAERQHVLNTLRFAEERQTKADQIAFDLSARSDLQKVSGVVLDFLFGPWSLAMANARLLDTRNQVDPEGFGSVVPDLIWSVKRDVTLKQPAKLIEMIPGMLEKLHSGLAMLGQDAIENEAFFESLMKLHRPVLKLRRLKSQLDAEESSAMLLEPEEPFTTPAERLEKLRAQADAPLWMGRSDLDAAGFEDTQPTDLGELAEQPDVQDEQTVSNDAAVLVEKLPPALLQTLPPPVDELREHDTAEAKAQATAILKTLKTGGWVDLYSKRQWLRAQLIWASSHATLFMFVSHGGQPHSMTKRSCEKLIAQILLRPVDMQGVVAQALDAVVLNATAQNTAAKRYDPSDPQNNNFSESETA